MFFLSYAEEKKKSDELQHRKTQKRKKYKRDPKKVRHMIHILLNLDWNEFVERIVRRSLFVYVFFIEGYKMRLKY